jgi:endonuclease YncB( thermonuclease family)
MKRFRLAAVLAVSLASAAAAQPLSTQHLTFKRARHCAAADIRVIDGDTIVCRGKHIRLLGLDTPELNIKCERERGLIAKAELQKLVAEPRRVLIREARQPDKYGRTLGVVLSNGQDVAPS